MHVVTLKDVLLTHVTYTFEEEAWQPPLADDQKG